MATQQQIPQEQQQFQPTLTKEQTRVSVNSYRDNPNPQYLETLRSHAQYHNVPFYEGEFGILDAIKQAAGGFWEGFTTLRLADPPDNEYEAIIRNVFHLGGFVPGFFAAPIRALGVAAKSKRLLEASRAIGGLKSIPMRGADWVTKHAKESVIRPALKSSIGSRFKAVDTTSKFMLQEGAKHITEGAFHLGVASSISSIWGGVDEMMHSFMGGAVAGGVFRGIGNIIPGTKAGDKALRALSGSIFMGMPSTARGATTPEQVYEYLLGAYFGGKEMPWSRARAHKVVQRGVEQATGTDKKQKDIKLDIERDPELIKGWEKEPEIVREEATKLWRKMYPEEAYNKGMAYYEMKLLGILDQIPEDKIEDVGYRVLHAVRKGRQRRTKTKAHEDINVATSGGSPEVETEWARVMDKYGVPVIQYLTPDKIYDYEKRYKAGKIPTTSIQRDLTIDELYDKAFVVDKANEILNRDISKLIPQSYEGILKNAWQIEKAGSVFAIGEIDTGRTGKDAHLNGRSVKGAPGWGIQMAIDKGLDKIYVFDQSKKQQRWYEWNHNANRFTPMGENIVPKLTRNPALLGPIPHKHKGRTYNRITKAGKEAIKSVARETFGEAPEQPKEVRTVPTPVKKYGQKNLQAQKRKEAEIDTKEKNILDMQEVINEGKVDKIRLKDLEARIKEEQKEIESLRGEIKVLKELGPTGYIDEITGEIVESSDVVDTGMKADDFPLMQKSERFATENLKDIWKDSSNRRNKILELGRITEDIIRKYIKKGDKDVKSLEAIKDMEKEFGKLSDIAKQQVRRWLTVENLGQNVTYVRSYGNSLLQITHPDNPVSLAGNPLRQVEAPKLIEDIFRAEGGTYGGKEFRTPLVIFDTVTGKKKNGLPVDVPLDRLFEYYRFTENMSKKEAEAKVISVKKDIINRMYNEHNMYALGGQGDKGRLVFVKFHPKTQSSSKTKIGTYITKVRKELKKVDKNYSSLLANDKDAARRELGISSEAFDKMLHSNVLYELSLNGLKNTPENIEKIMKHNPDEPGEGFISNAIAYNKRAQIWLMGGYSGDKNFLVDKIKDMGLPKDADYYGSSGKDFKTKSGQELKQDNDSYYRGFYGAPRIDKNGNLIITPVKDDMFSRRFPGKGIGTSVTGDSKQAREYALTRYNQQARMLDQAAERGIDYDNIYESMEDIPSTVLKINKKAFNDAIQGKEILKGQEPSVEGLEGEQRVVTKEKIIIPKGKWESYEMDMVEKTGGALDFIKENALAQGSDFRYVLIKDPKKSKLSSLLAKNVDLPEHVDGAIIVRDDVIMAINEDAAHPVSGQNKSFIIAPSREHGALLGKYMMHTAGKQASKEMARKGLHMMVMTSSAKQYGTRTAGDYTVTNGKLALQKAPIYNLNPGSIKYTTSVTNTPHMLQKQIWVKQLFTNLHQYGYETIDKSIISDIHQEIIQKSFKGNKTYNTKLDNYLKTLDRNVVDDLVENLENLGTTDLIKALKTPGAELFAERAMQKMLRIIEKDIEMQFQEGEITAAERGNTLSDMKQAISPIDNMLRQVAFVGEKAAMEGKAAYSGYMHKYLRDYKAAVLHNYFVKSTTRPSVDNSAVARIRPYDKWMQEDFKDLNTNDTIFYLDNAYRDTLITLPDGEKISLGKLWRLKDSSEYKDIAQEVFDAVVLRVPMDSISGAHRLTFKGFTDREGHGIMMHARTMRALGGADLDGDEAFVYFGGRAESGKGYGMKKSWKEAIHAQKEEFYEGEGSKRDVQNNKDAFRDELTLGAGKDNPLKTSKALYFSPYSRIKASEGAVDGRNRLGVAVSNAQILKSAYSALMEADGKIDKYNFYDKFSKKTYRVTRTPKESDSERKRQRDLTRAQIAFASDPLDEVGLKDANVFFTKLHDAYFNIKMEVYNPKTKRFEKPYDLEYDKKIDKYVIWEEKVIGKSLSGHKMKDIFDKELEPFELKKGLVETFKNMNSAYFGRNYAEGRRFTMDEVNELASSIANLDPKQINTMLPKMVSTLEGLDWSDSIFNRVDRVRIKDYYDEINKMTGVKFNWLRKHMDRSSFKVPYNNHIDVVVKNKLFDRDVRRRLAADTSTRGLINYLDAIKGTIWAKEVMKDINNSITTTKSGKKYIKPDTWFFNEKKRLSHLSLLARQAEDFLSNDLADISTILNIKRILDRTKGTGELTGTRIDYITRKVEQIKTRSYLNVKERRKVKYDAYLGTEEEQNLQKAFDYVDDYNAKQQGKIPKQKELLGDKRSASWDQKKIDDEIIIFKRGLKNDSEKELFDHLLIGSLKRGKVQELQNLLSKINLKIYNPAVLDVITQAINESADTRLSRVGFNSQAVSSKAMRDHFEMMNDALVDTWKVPSSKDINKEIENVNKAAKENNIGEVSEVDDMVEGVLRGEAYAGIKKADITQKDKELMVRLASNLKKHNNKLGNNLNEVLGGIMVEATGRAKDLNTMNRQDFILVNEFLEEVNNGTMFQKMFGKKGAPEIKRRYWWMFPEAVNRELMAYDIKWLKEEGYFLTKDGTAKARPIRRPTYFLEILQNWVHKSGSLATAKAEELASKTEADFLNIRELKEGEALFDIAVRGRELSEKESIDKTDELQPIKDMWKKNYDNSYRDAKKKHNWEKLRKQKFTLTNDAGERVTVSGQEIVFGSKKKHNLTGIRDKLTKKFEEYHKLIVGDKSMRDEYIEKDKYGTGIYYDGVEQTQPKMNWRKFVKDMGNALEKGQDIPVQLGIDGMRHMARSMMADLSKGKYKEDFEAMHIGKTGQRNPEAYWPHMFFSRSQAERSMQKAIEHIRQRPDLTEEQKKKQIANITVRHKTLTGDWEFQDMQDWDRIDVLDMEQAYKDIADVKKKQKEKEKTDIKWTNMNQKFGSMFSRKGHIAGWATDISVLNAYTRNLTQTYYRQLTQIMSRDVLDKSYHRMSKKFGPELAKRWDKFFKLYVQGAMGQPDIIPEEIYNDPKMKIKGTPYAWFADNKVLDRVNKIRKKLGIREDGLPKELKDFTYQDIRAWSNLEAKWELASLLAHPKSSITNIWGGSLHTIQSAGLTALRKARNIKYLQRINPNWTSMKDVEKFVISKGIIPEFLVHELGLGREVSKKNIQDFVGELSEKINSNDPIARKEIRSLGKKYNLGEEVTRLASKFMSVPERMLRRDAFMAHYIRAWERYGGAIRDPNHPFLIEMGKKGVKATQFLYEAPFRPFFARTALGKVMSRFQLFAWNSARFRNDIMRGAKLYGFKPGSEAFQRYKRTMEIDLFVLALGNMFAFSLFDNALPSPWNWFQDTSEWLFGDEKERDKAFFGMYPSKIAPLQVITPPIARFPVSALRQWIDDDYSKFSEYTAWTLFPFGRMIRDVAQPDQGLIHNPTRIIEKVAGLPVQDLARQRRKKKEAIEKGERYQLPGVGIKF